MSSVDVEDLLEADGSIFETPVPCFFLTVAQVVNPSCKWRCIVMIYASIVYHYGHLK